MKVVIKRAGMKPITKEIEDNLSEFQAIVGGYIEVFPFFNNVVCVCNEEGKLHNLPLNFILPNDVIVGDVFFIGTDGEDFASLTDDEIEFINRIFVNKK